MEKPIIFNYHEFEIRVADQQDEQSWFVAKDICDVLELADVSMSLKRLDDDEKLIQKVFVSGQKRDTWTINEFGLYNLILTSTKPEAKEFKRWICHEVLPQIRKAGKYSTEEAKQREGDLQLLTKRIADNRAQLSILGEDIKDIKSQIEADQAARDELILNHQKKIQFDYKEV